ncbi:MAG: hypothetical protein K5662_07670 [Lachnospiraceae bacterium]|nr:hypothetical protein [Lachnospiraceae bacterium]
MGEWIKNIGELHIGNSVFNVELNEPVSNDSDRIIHIQNDNARFLLTETEFLQMSTLALQAMEQLKNYKKVLRGDKHNND